MTDWPMPNPPPYPADDEDKPPRPWMRWTATYLWGAGLGCVLMMTTRAYVDLSVNQTTIVGAFYGALGISVMVRAIYPLNERRRS